MNFQYLLDWDPRDKEFFLPHPTINALSFYKGIRKEFPYDFIENISTWVQKIYPSSLLEHFRNEGVFKGLHINNPFHDDRGLLVEIVIGRVCLNASEVFWVRAWTLWSLFCGRVLSRRHLQKLSQTQKHKTRTQT